MWPFLFAKWRKQTKLVWWSMPPQRSWFLMDDVDDMDEEMITQRPGDTSWWSSWSLWASVRWHLVFDDGNGRVNQRDSDLWDSRESQLWNHTRNRQRKLGSCVRGKGMVEEQVFVLRLEGSIGEWPRCCRCKCQWGEDHGRGALYTCVATGGEAALCLWQKVGVCFCDEIGSRRP